MLFGFIKRLEAAERSIAALQEALARPVPPPPGGGEEKRPPAFKLDDAKMQEGIANLMGYDPFVRKGSDVE